MDVSSVLSSLQIMTIATHRHPSSLEGVLDFSIPLLLTPRTGMTRHYKVYDFPNLSVWKGLFEKFSKYIKSRFMSSLQVQTRSKSVSLRYSL